MADGPPPIVKRHAAGYERTVLWQVAVSIVARKGPTAIRVYLDDSRQVRVAEAEVSLSPVPSTAAISKAEALAAASHALGLVGIDAEPGELEVWSSKQGQFWTMTLGRQIDGHPVANHVAATGLAGDRLWVTLNGSGELVELYAVRPAANPVTDILPVAQLQDRLADVIGLPPSSLSVLHPSLVWLRALDEDGVEAPVLSLNYCATKTGLSSWDSWCVDAVSGNPSANGFGAD